MKFPWDDVHTLTVTELPGPPALADTVTALQRDFVYAVQFTAVRVHSNRPEMCVTVNTPRGQIIPRGIAKFSDGTTTEFQDIGMPQIGVSSVECVTELVGMILDTAKNLGLSL